jgi:TatD DNase family protein
MELFDTHAHFEGSETEIREILCRATAAGVGAVMAVGGSPELNRGALAAARIGAELAMRLPVALGWDRDQCARELPELDCSLAAAVGEIGLDYHYDGASRREQLEHFSRQLELASRLGKPVVIHTREADDDTLGVLREIPSKGVIHCFTGSPEFCRKLLDLGFYISISGIVTFRLADNVRESALVVPDDRLLVETDSPFLAPVPMRGKPNEPAFLVHTAHYLAKLRNTAPEILAAFTSANAERMLGLDSTRGNVV